MSFNVVVLLPDIQRSIVSVFVEEMSNFFQNYTTYLSCGLRVKEVTFITVLVSFQQCDKIFERNDIKRKGLF